MKLAWLLRIGSRSTFVSIDLRLSTSSCNEVTDSASPDAESSLSEVILKLGRSGCASGARPGGASEYRAGPEARFSRRLARPSRSPGELRSSEEGGSCLPESADPRSGAQVGLSSRLGSSLTLCRWSPNVPLDRSSSNHRGYSPCRAYLDTAWDMPASQSTRCRNKQPFDAGA